MVNCAFPIWNVSSISLNPKLAGAYHILGRWHRAIAGFNVIEKAMINSFFGGVPPGGSYEDALKSFMTAIGIEPKYMNHQYELAQTYYPGVQVMGDLSGHNSFYLAKKAERLKMKLLNIWKRWMILEE